MKCKDVKYEQISFVCWMYVFVFGVCFFVKLFISLTNIFFIFHVLCSNSNQNKMCTVIAKEKKISVKPPSAVNEIDA